MNTFLKYSLKLFFSLLLVKTATIIFALIVNPHIIDSLEKSESPSISLVHSMRTLQSIWTHSPGVRQLLRSCAEIMFKSFNYFCIQARAGQTLSGIPVCLSLTCQRVSLGLKYVFIPRLWHPSPFKPNSKKANPSKSFLPWLKRKQRIWHKNQTFQSDACSHWGK